MGTDQSTNDDASRLPPASSSPIPAKKEANLVRINTENLEPRQI